MTTGKGPGIVQSVPTVVNKYRQYGAAAPVYISTADAGSVLFNDACEFAGTVWFRGNPSFLGRLLFSSSSSTSGGFIYGADDGLRLFTGPNDNQGNNNYIFTTAINSAKDHDHDTNSTDPEFHFHSAKDVDSDNQDFATLTKLTDGDFQISTNTGNIKLTATTGITEVTGNGLLTKEQSVAVADDGSIDLPDATDGFLTVSCNGEYAYCYIQTDGTVTLVNNSANVANTDTDTNLCVFDNGTAARIRNRLGAQYTVRYSYKYSA